MYKIIESTDKERLIEYVNNDIKEGFEPLGGISVTYANDYCTYAQALYKKQLADKQGEK